MATIEERLVLLEERLGKLEGKSLLEMDAAKVLLSGALPRQRIHWAQEIGHTDRVVVIGSVAIWTIFLQQGTAETAWSVGATSAISSVLIGLWRLNVRWVDLWITRLYPAIVRYERVLGIPDEASTVPGLMRHYKTVEALQKAVSAKRIGVRGHLVFDWIAITVILIMALGTIWVGDVDSLTWCNWNAPFHSYILLIFNLVGAVLVGFAMNAFQTVSGGLGRYLGWGASK